VHLNKCRCGAEPRIAARTDEDGAIYAVHCENLCGDDSHWQMSLTEAVDRWNSGLVRGASGGNGAAEQDLQKSTS
jgi:hypothetical protein